MQNIRHKLIDANQRWSSSINILKVEYLNIGSDTQSVEIADNTE